jgi:hypothetical protein
MAGGRERRSYFGLNTKITKDTKNAVMPPSW